MTNGIIVNGRNKFKIAIIGSRHDFTQRLQTVNVFLHRCFFLCGRSIAVYYLTVVFKKSYIVDCCFDAQYVSKLIIHFYGCLIHAVFNTAAFYANMIVVAYFTFIIAMHFFAKESNNILWLYAVYGFGNKLFIEWF